MVQPVEVGGTIVYREKSARITRYSDGTSNAPFHPVSDRSSQQEEREAQRPAGGVFPLHREKGAEPGSRAGEGFPRIAQLVR